MWWNDMARRAESTWAIWIACVGIGLLYLVRSFQNYMTPMFGQLSHGTFSFSQITWLATAFLFPQSICAPLVGWYADRTSLRLSLLTSIVLGIAAFLIISAGPIFPLAFFAVFLAGLAFILGKISLNTILVLHSSPDSLRRSVAKRATLLNLGSFCGNTLAQAPRMGYSIYAIVLSLFYVPLAFALLVEPSPKQQQKKPQFKWEHVRRLLGNQIFLADALRRFALTLPYGCWGFVISTYVIGVYGGDKLPVWRNSMTNLLTTLLGAHFLAVYLSRKLYARGFKWEWWSMTSVSLFCIGMLLLVFARNPVMLAVAIVVFTSGEVLMTPCFDETAKKHSGEETMSTCMGLLHFVDGAGRWIGQVFAAAVYATMLGRASFGWYWPTVVAVFFTVSGLLHVVCYFLGRREDFKRPVIIQPTPSGSSALVPALPESEF
jgi:MFS family permease